ncbi:hypothetical protein CCMSSC00406_0010180 [Pleurotus cornucopiae]|uniref:Uncharacterized protein n=1 Tax=Pleurotus cornucopiae TaxID=5321 RepID=A0ACB7INA4_PLECO|nr:hypothetical protein CCMSSC00406_0010180 [Pleurotus cornucopiae]
MASDTPTIPMIDEVDVSGENGDMNLFSWLASTEKKLTDASPDTLKGTQNTLEQIFVKIISTSCTLHTRAILQLVARCLIKLYRRGETRTLFDTLQALMKIVGDFKVMDKDTVKVAAFSCIGDLMYEFGSQVMSFMAEISMVTLRTAKSSNSPLLRYHALVTLRKSLNSAKRAVTDASAKNPIKQMRNGLTDKCMPVQRASAEVLVAMYSADSLPSSSDVDTIIMLCVKNLDSVDQVTRRTLAQLVGHLLASTQIERTVVIQEPAAKGVKKDGQALGDDPLSLAGGTSTEIKKPMFTPAEMLTHLGTHFTKTLTSSSGLAARKTRVGIFDFYFALITKLGHHSLKATMPSTLRYETLLIRNAVGILVRDVIGVRMLSEQGQIGAIQELSNSYLKRWPAMMPGQVAPSSTILVVALREVAGLLQQLGNAPPPVQDAVSEPLVTLLTHPSHSVRVNASWALRCFCYSTPLRLPQTILGVTDMLQRDLTSILSPAAPSDINLRALGHAYGLAALVSIVKERPLYVSYDISAKVLDMATQLLKRAGDHDLKVAWTLIASLMSLGLNFVRPHLPQLLVLWRNALPHFRWRVLAWLVAQTFKGDWWGVRVQLGVGGGVDVVGDVFGRLGDGPGRRRLSIVERCRVPWPWPATFS